LTKHAQRRYAALDGLRGIAALMVFAIHVWIYQLPNTVQLRRDSWEKTLLFEGRVAFVMFFVLSGYLLYRAFARAALRGGEHVNVRSYLVRRAARIVPAYYVAILGAALFVAGTRWLHLATLAAGTVVTLLSILWVLPAAGVQILREYQVDRLIGFWNPDSDPSGATYNISQSITAVGSGGLDGRGVAGATQTNMNYLPEHSTDFIFSSLAEQRGFLGAALLLLLYAIVVWRGVRTIAIAPSLFTATIAAGCVVAFVFQVFVNVGMTIGMAPITGIPLPFVSYGGSSMIATLAMIGLLQAVHVRGRLAAER